MERGDEHGARQAWRSAAESWRSCDRPVRAAKALAAAMRGAAPDASSAALLAGVLQDSGQLQAARVSAEEAVAAATSPGTRVLSLDVLIGVLLVLGEVDSARGRLVELRSVPIPAAQLAGAFRAARLDRLDGALDQAVQRLDAVVTALPAADRRFAAPRAAALHEIAEYSLLAGNLEQSRTVLGAARAAWGRSGRRPGALAAEGLAVRIQLAAGEVVIPSALDNGIAFSDDRGLPLLGAELRIARGRARASADAPGASVDFDEAVHQGRRACAPLLEGRARLWRWISGCPADAGDREQIRRRLAIDRVLSRHPVLISPVDP